MMSNNPEKFGDLLRHLRESSGLPIRKVAAFLDLDPSTLAKIERGERMANRNQVERLAKLFRTDSRELLISFFSDKVIYELVDEEFGSEVLKAAEKKIKYLRSKGHKQ
jgi:transcriptional regulator with XRE-family HTH domain